MADKGAVTALAHRLCTTTCSGGLRPIPASVETLLEAAWSSHETRKQLLTTTPAYQLFQARASSASGLPPGGRASSLGGTADAASLSGSAAERVTYRPSHSISGHSDASRATSAYSSASALQARRAPGPGWPAGPAAEPPALEVVAAYDANFQAANSQGQHGPPLRTLRPIHIGGGGWGGGPPPPNRRPWAVKPAETRARTQRCTPDCAGRRRVPAQRRHWVVRPCVETRPHPPIPATARYPPAHPPQWSQTQMRAAQPPLNCASGASAGPSRAVFPVRRPTGVRVPLVRQASLQVPRQPRPPRRA
jgi:hypothetical protein